MADATTTRANALDRLIAWVSPQAALRRASARAVLAHYEGASTSTQRSKRLRNEAPNDIAARGATPLRAIARDLERNHDIFRGALRVLVNSTIGPNGIGVEPQPRRKDGTIHTEYAALLSDAWRHHCKRPEVTRRYSDSLMQRLLAYTWFRDGEVFAQQLYGEVPYLRHGSPVPYSLELFEPDFVPMDYNDPARGITQGIQTNAWGQPVAFHLYKTDPRSSGYGFAVPANLKTLPAERVLHIATLDRLHQLRGVSEFASVLDRISDLKEYEESERIAAKVAASLTGYVKRTNPDGFNPADVERNERGEALPRDVHLQPGVIIDNLLVGEEIGLIDSNRPNPNLIGWRAGQLKAIAAGIGAGYSSIARSYDGTYSAQRQELVEQWVHYAVLADEFTSMFVQPHYERFVEVAHLSGVVPRPMDVSAQSADDALYLAQSMPWIDPLKEVQAWEKRTQAGFASEVQAIRAAGGNPRDVLQQISEWRAQVAALNLRFSSDAATPAGQAQPQQEPQKASE